MFCIFFFSFQICSFRALLAIEDRDRRAEPSRAEPAVPTAATGDQKADYQQDFGRCCSMPPGFLVHSSIGLDPGLCGPFFFLCFFLMLDNKQYIKGAGRPRQIAACRRCSARVCVWQTQAHPLGGK
jgi:hypothetical protein